jgi:dTDP-4-amino-4,6-dideoxygalactose transaminase
LIEHTRPILDEAEEQAVLRVIRSRHLAMGTEVAALESEFAALVGVDHAIALANGTVSIEIGLQTLGIGPGDEVIVPSFTFIATANAVRRQGAKPVFADIDPKTYCLSPASVERRITANTRAVIAVHLYGHPADVDALGALCEESRIDLVEDAAQGIGSYWRGRSVGSFGRFASFSLYATKNVTTGEGGMITTNDPIVAERARSLRSHQSQMVGQRLQVATNARMTDLQAAIGRAQLSKIDRLQAARDRLAAVYERSLGPEVTTPYVAPEAKHGYHQYTIRTQEREGLISRLVTAGVGYGVYYPTPIHLSDTYVGEGERLPDTEAVSKEVLSLPIRPDLTHREQMTVISAVNGEGGL